jgi:hypothetical protein
MNISTDVSRRDSSPAARSVMHSSQPRGRGQFLDPRIMKASFLGPRDSPGRQPTRSIRAFTAEFFDVVLNIGEERRKACKIQFRFLKQGLAAYVHMSSFGYTYGRLRRVEFKGAVSGPESVSFMEGGITTTRMMKYNHPPDGNAHFSQDGKVHSYFAKSKPLRTVAGHLFSFHFWGADAFDLAGTKEARPPTSKRATVNLYADPELAADQVAGRIVGWCYPRSVVPLVGPIDPVAGPAEPAAWTVESGEVRQTLVIAPPNPPPVDDLIFFVTFHPMDRSTGPDYPVLVFMGGFNASRDQTRTDSYSNCLALKYSEEEDDFEEMVRLCGSIDYMPEVFHESEGAA